MRELAETPSERPQPRIDVPEVVVARLPQYVRVLNTLLSDGLSKFSALQKTYVAGSKKSPR